MYSNPVFKNVNLQVVAPHIQEVFHSGHVLLRHRHLSLQGDDCIQAASPGCLWCRLWSVWYTLTTSAQHLHIWQTWQRFQWNGPAGADVGAVPVSVYSLCDSEHIFLNKFKQEMHFTIAVMQAERLGIPDEMVNCSTFWCLDMRGILIKRSCPGWGHPSVWVSSTVLW